MRVACALVLALLATGCAGPQRDEPPRLRDTATQAEKAGDFHFLVAAREFDDDAAWGDLGDQSALGVIWSAEPAGSWIGWEVGLFGSWEDTTVRTPNGPESTADLDATSLEGSLGFVKSVRVGERLRPYAGAGIALLHVEYETPLDGTSEVLNDDDERFGGYARAGVLLQWNETSHFGLDFRAFRGASGSIAGIEYDTDYEQFALVFGASF